MTFFFSFFLRGDLMKLSLFRQSFLSCIGLLAVSAAAQVTHATTVTFESTSDLADFNQIAAAGGASTNFTHSASAGTNGSGGLVHSATGPQDATAVYTPTSFDLTTGATYTLSIDYKTGPAAISGSSNAIVMLGFLAENNGGFYSLPSDAYIGGRVRRRSSGSVEGLQSQTKAVGGTPTASPADSGLADIAFVTDNWYRFSLSVTRDGSITNQFSYSLTLLDLGPTGTGVPAAVVNGTLAGTFMNASFYNDTTTYAAFRGVPTVANGSVAFDNFTVPTLVPEPASAGLLGVCLLGLITRRGRTQR
jgi:hypothetical protein